MFILLRLANLSASYIVQNHIYKDETIRYSNLKSLYKDDFEKIDLGVIERIGGWLEILDENYKVVFIKGQKKDGIMRYTDEQLFEIASPQESYPEEKNYLGEITVAEGKNGQKYILLLKFDKRKVSRTTVYQPSFFEKEDIPIILKTKGIDYLLICIYLLIGIYIYSRISSKFITRPLRAFVDSIKKMKEQDYGVRLNIDGLKELTEVEEEFNNMIQKLQEVEKEKEKIDNSKKRLIVDISHDLKTPITSIQGFSKLLLEEDVTPEKKEKFLNIIYSKSVYAARLIEHLFQLSKLEDTEYNMNMEKSDFSEWLKRLIAEYYWDFQNSGFNLEVNISEQSIILKFDHNLMKRAISNVLSNSLIYNHAGVTVVISCCIDNEAVLLKISDNGIGIEEGIKEKIFEPFVKSEERKSKGSGLGLAITKKIIERHGGTISLSSNVNTKTLFTIRIPLKEKL